MPTQDKDYIKRGTFVEGAFVPDAGEKLRESLREIAALTQDWRGGLTEEERNLISHACAFTDMVRQMEKSSGERLEWSTDSRALFAIKSLVGLLDRLEAFRCLKIV